MKCFWFFHKWGEWAKPRMLLARYIWSPVESEEWYQSRTCARCGKFEVRRIEF